MAGTSRPLRDIGRRIGIGVRSCGCRGSLRRSVRTGGRACGRMHSGRIRFSRLSQLRIWIPRATCAFLALANTCGGTGVACVSCRGVVSCYRGGGRRRVSAVVWRGSFRSGYGRQRCTIGSWLTSLEMPVETSASCAFYVARDARWRLVLRLLSYHPHRCCKWLLAFEALVLLRGSLRGWERSVLSSWLLVEVCLSRGTGLERRG